MAKQYRIAGRKSRNLVGASFLLAISHVGAGGCGPAFDSCEDSRTCPPPKGGSSGESGAAGASDAQPEGGAANAGAGAGATGGRSAGDATAGDGGTPGNDSSAGRASGGGDGAPTESGGTAGHEAEEGGRAQAGAGGSTGGRADNTTGGLGLTGGGGATGGVHTTGGINSIGGEGGEAGEGSAGAPGTDCSGGDTLLCSQLFGASSASCSGLRVACVNGRWPKTCIEGARDCSSVDDNDCDGQRDNILDATCVCGAKQNVTCDLTPENADDCAVGISSCILRANNASTYWGACRERPNDPPPTYDLNRAWDPNDCLLGSACTQTNGQSGTMQSRCTTYPSTCGYLYCML